MSVALGAVLLDWDGTLVDSRAAVLAAWRSVPIPGRPRQFPDGPDEEALALTTAEAQVLGRLVGDAPAAAALVDRYRAAYLAGGSGVAAFPGLADMLSALRERGERLGVVTSKARAPFLRDAAVVGVADGFDAVIAGDSGHTPKPDAAPVRACLAALGVAPDRALLVGDAPGDVVAGRAAGVLTAVILHGFDAEAAVAAGPDYVVERLADVPALVASLASQRSSASHNGA